MESNYNKVAEYKCPCGKILTANMLHENENKDTVACECGSVWMFEPYQVTRVSGDIKEWPKRTKTPISSELLNGKEISSVIIDRMNEIVDVFSFKPAYIDWLGEEKKTYVSETIYQPKGHLGSIKLGFHYGDKLDRINLKREVSDTTSDEYILESLDLFEDHIIEYMRTGELSDEYKKENDFSSCAIEEVVRIENYC